MLVLSRRCGEQIVIAENIVVTVGAIEGNKVRIGVDAPNSIRVDRKEVHDRRVFEQDDVPAFETSLISVVPGAETDGCPA